MGNDRKGNGGGRATKSDLLLTSATIRLRKISNMMRRSDYGLSGDTREDYLKYRRSKIVFMVAVVVLSLVILIVSFCVGKYTTSFEDTLRLLYQGIFGEPFFDVTKGMVVWEVRMPRAIMALLVGAVLGVAGAVMQSMLQNPLADPYTTGVSSGASLGVALCVITGFSFLPGLPEEANMIISAFLFSLIPVAIILAVSAFRKVTSVSIILVGIGIMYIFSAAVQMIKLISSPRQMEKIYIWQLGSLADATLANIAVVAIVAAVCIIVLYTMRDKFNILSTGDNLAVAMGVNPWKTRIQGLVVVSLMTSVAVSFTGTIGFVGLAVPQMVRLFIGSDNNYLIPASAVTGAGFLIAADIVAKNIGVSGLPVGVITAIIGSPIFIFLLYKQSKKTY